MGKKLANPPEPDNGESEPLCYIFETERRMWWRHYCHGYTMRITEAGTWPESVALRLCAGSTDDVPVSVAELDKRIISSIRKRAEVSR